MQGSRSARVSVWERVSSGRPRDHAPGARDHALSGALLYKKRRPPSRVMHILPSFECFDAPSSNFCSFLLLFLYFSIVFLCFPTVMDFPPVPEDLGVGPLLFPLRISILTTCHSLRL